MLTDTFNHDKVWPWNSQTFKGHGKDVNDQVKTLSDY